MPMLPLRPFQTQDARCAIPVEAEGDDVHLRGIIWYLAPNDLGVRINSPISGQQHFRHIMLGTPAAEREPFAHWDGDGMTITEHGRRAAQELMQEIYRDVVLGASESDD